MNYKTLLMASAAVLFSTQAMAQDLTGAFSVPGKGQIMSDTTLSMSRTKTKYHVSMPNLGPIVVGGSHTEKYIADGAYASETVEYGVTDKFSVNASIANTFDVDEPDYASHWDRISYNNDHNFAYTLGAKYNTQFNDVLFQVAGEYNTWQPTTWYGHKSYITNKWQKNIGLDLKAGLDLGNGITPYIVYHIDSGIDTAHRELTQSVSAGVHKYAGKWALDGAIRYEFTKNHQDWFGKNTTETWFDAEADYYLRDNIALGLYGNYLIDAHDRTYKPAGMPGAIITDVKEHKNFDYEVGLRVKVLF